HEHSRRHCELSKQGIRSVCAACRDPFHVARDPVCPVKSVTCFCCGLEGHTVVQCEHFKPRYDEIKLVPYGPQAFPKLTKEIKTTTATATPTTLPVTSPTPSFSSVSCYSPASSRSSPVLRDPSSSSPPHKRSRHVSIDSDSEYDYESRPNHSPLSPRFQQHLDNSSLTRAATPAPSCSSSSSRSR